MPQGKEHGSPQVCAEGGVKKGRNFGGSQGSKHRVCAGTAISQEAGRCSWLVLSLFPPVLLCSLHLRAGPEVPEHRLHHGVLLGVCPQNHRFWLPGECLLLPFVKVLIWTLAGHRSLREGVNNGRLLLLILDLGPRAAFGLESFGSHCISQRWVLLGEAALLLYFSPCALCLGHACPVLLLCQSPLLLHVLLAVLPCPHR